MDPILEKYATIPVPRYTSYPAAPHFTKGFPGATYAGWLGALPLDEPVSLYLHIPFCRKVCWYCGCNMKLAARYDPVGAYVDTLLREIDLVGVALPGRLKVSHLHFGGGTPTVLSEEDLERVMAALKVHFTFPPGAELAMESDPRTITPGMMDKIGELGFNRASFGIQEFDPAVQAAINRVQPPEMVQDAVDGLRAAGVSSINFDLIYGLPHQSAESLSRTIDRCVEMEPDRIALFGYAHVPWMAKNQRMIPEEALPGAEERSRQAEAAATAWKIAGYEAIGLDHFARPHDPLAAARRDGTLRRNFQGYTTDTARALIGFGATSIGRAPWGFVQNIAETGAWARAVEAETFPIAKGHAFSLDDRVRGRVIEDLMCNGAADIMTIALSYGVEPDWCSEGLAQLAEMEADGLVAYRDGVLRMTEKGQPLVRLAAAAFDRYRQRTATRHSVAI